MGFLISLAIVLYTSRSYVKIDVCYVLAVSWCTFMHLSASSEEILALMAVHFLPSADFGLAVERSYLLL